MKQTAISLVIASALLAATPALGQQPAPNQAAQTRQAGSPSKLVLDNSTRILSTLESRRAEFTRDRAALSKFVSSEFNQMFDRDYAGRLVLGVHGRTQGRQAQRKRQLSGRTHGHRGPQRQRAGVHRRVVA